MRFEQTPNPLADDSEVEDIPSSQSDLKSPSRKLKDFYFGRYSQNKSSRFLVNSVFWSECNADIMSIYLMTIWSLSSILRLLNPVANRCLICSIPPLFVSN